MLKKIFFIVFITFLVFCVWFVSPFFYYDYLPKFHSNTYYINKLITADDIEDRIFAAMYIEKYKMIEAIPYLVSALNDIDTVLFFGKNNTNVAEYASSSLIRLSGIDPASFCGESDILEESNFNQLNVCLLRWYHEEYPQWMLDQIKYETKEK